MHTRDLIQFLAELGENNNRAWFVMNKPRYDILREEFQALVAQLVLDLGRFDPAVADCNPRKAIFRINRDMRFSHDKSPYKTHFAAAITASGLKKPSQGGGPAYYFHIDGTGTLLIGGGEWMPPKDRLQAIRQAIVDDPSGFAKVIKNKKMKESFGDLQEEGKLQRPPKGFDIDHPHIEYIKLKSFIVWKETNLKKSLPKDLGKELAASFKETTPLVNWLRQIPLAAAP
jgi:uncharacterized protein (TIGR02453 family)